MTKSKTLSGGPPLRGRGILYAIIFPYTDFFCPYTVTFDSFFYLLSSFHYFDELHIRNKDQNVEFGKFYFFIERLNPFANYYFNYE